MRIGLSPPPDVEWDSETPACEGLVLYTTPGIDPGTLVLPLRPDKRLLPRLPFILFVRSPGSSGEFLIGGGSIRYDRFTGRAGVVHGVRAAERSRLPLRTDSLRAFFRWDSGRFVSQFNITAGRRLTLTARVGRAGPWVESGRHFEFLDVQRARAMRWRLGITGQFAPACPLWLDYESLLLPVLRRRIRPLWAWLFRNARLQVQLPQDVDRKGYPVENLAHPERA